MKKILFFSGGMIALSLLFVSTLSSQKAEVITDNKIQWMDLEEAAQQTKIKAKPILIDVYSDWCKWCKVMEESTFQDPEMIQYINENYYAVKLNAEEKRDIAFKGKVYTYRELTRRGVNELAVNLLGDRPSYPSIVLLGKNLEQKKVLKGYQKKQGLLPILAKYKEDNLLTSN